MDRTDTDAGITVGLISDTHGLLRPEALEALAGSDLIVHAGDICDPQILEALARIAPVSAVRGNNDHGDWATRIPQTEVVRAGASLLYVVHDLADLDLDPAAAGFAAVIHGHSHRPGCVERDGVLFINPGSAGPRRFTLPIAVARLHVGPRGLRHETLELSIPSRGR